MSAVRYHPDPAQRELVEGFDRPLQVLLPLARLHVSLRERPEVWTGLGELGLFGIALPEAEGGVGLGAVEEMLVSERLGGQLAAPGVFATMTAAHATGLGALASVLGAGEARVASAWRDRHGLIVVDPEGADFVLIRDSESAILHPVTDLEQVTPVDDHLWLASLMRASVSGAPTAMLGDAALLRARLIDAAALAGIARAACAMAVAYAGIREQFGRSIGSFQAIKHMCADMAMAARAAADQASFAAIAIDDGRTDAALQVECALLLAIRSALDNARTNIQVHGGIGFSDEADPHLLLKRAHLQATIAGGAEAAVSRVAAADAAL